MNHIAAARGAFNAFGSISCMLIVKRIWTCHMEFALYKIKLNIIIIIIMVCMLSFWFLEYSQLVYGHTVVNCTYINSRATKLWIKCSKMLYHCELCLSSVIVQRRVILRKTVVGDWCFNYLSGSHIQSQGLLYCSGSWNITHQQQSFSRLISTARSH